MYLFMVYLSVVPAAQIIRYDLWNWTVMNVAGSGRGLTCDTIPA